MVTPNNEYQAFAALVSDRLAALVARIVGDAEILRNRAERQDVPELLKDFDRIVASSRKLEAMVETCHRHLSDGGKTLGKAKTDFRHDLRTPINAIKGYGQLIMEEFEDRGINVMNSDFDRLIRNAELLERETTMLSSGTEAAEPEPAGGKEGGDIATSIAGYTVFVIDDDKGSRNFLSRLLRRRGCGVRTSSSGADALNKLSKEGADIILLDMVMPGMSGLDVLNLIKAHPQLKTIPVVMVSGLDDDTPLIQCLEAGAEAFLKKPISFDDLINVLVRRRDEPALMRPSMEPQKIIDYSRIKAIQTDLGRDVLLELIKDFSKVSTGHVSDIHHAAINDEREAWGRAAHGFKSAARIMGLQRLSEICREIEDACDAGRPDDAVRFTGMLDEHLAEAQAALDKLGAAPIKTF